MFLQKQFHLDSNEEQVQDLNLALSSAESKNGNSQVFFVEDNHAALQQLGGEPPWVWSTQRQQPSSGKDIMN